MFLYLAPVVVFGLIGIGFAWYMAKEVLASDQGTAEMQDISNRIYQGAVAYLTRQYQTIFALALVVSVVIGGLVYMFEHDHKTARGVITALAFLAGALLSGVSGIISMWVAVKSNVRVAAGAVKGTGPAMTIAMRGGAVSGFLVIALGLLGLLGVYGIVYQFAESSQGWATVAETPFWIVGFGFGASFVALFAQLGGGIYTKAADVGADLVGKVEAGIPEDDPRNPAVIADLVGDNVGDCAGRGADIFESSAAEMTGAMILGVALFNASGGASNDKNIIWIFFPLVLAAFGLLASIIGVFSVRPPQMTEKPMAELNKGFYITAGIAAVMLVAICQLLPFGKWEFAAAGLVGLATSIAFLYITQYYTESNFRPVKNIAEASKTGPATNIISGISVGFETTGLAAITICIALFTSFTLGKGVEGFDMTVANIEVSSGIFGTAVATMGMLMTAAYILAMDTFGPITDNAGGIVEMSDAPDEIRDVTDALDSVGNTTKALTKGYAVGSASLAAFLLFSAFLDEVQRFSTSAIDRVVNLAEPKVFIGALIGAALVYVFSSFAMSAVGRAATDMIEEVRRQFRADPGIMQGTSQPDYRACVDISVRSALREMILPGSLAVVVPVIVGVLLGWEAAAGMLMVGTIVGVLMALVMNNGGGAWDNAKKSIEAGLLTDADGNVLGKGSDAHAAAVVGDTVGDPWKDTAGPSLHVLVKLLATITLVLAPLFI
ncbi:MAG: sodium-translocating pyrophosphatase [Thermomicrobiales bacterium]|nr:sodium-translocating pyrophosphatase [Thermomicrobiales bacterium]MCO5218395.1 sodium-translocating pyrophosphatase [Thermomicrobiales bacterium]MCO5223857.1 sodium-translocating pyrophosphatase [Thermomicrobiales bacterium]MCO5227421.1 sodium-translocating pyrophosphatase [Thermomicrobiales bacterium]